MREILQKTIRELWQGADTTPDIIVALEDRGIRVTEKTVLDAAMALGMEGSNIQSKLFKSPGIIDGWWKKFGLREEASALELINAGNVKGIRGVGKARHIAGCYLADEMLENGGNAAGVAEALKQKGFEKREIEKISKDVGF